MTGIEAIAAAGAIIGGVATFQQMQYQAAVATANAKQSQANADYAYEVAQKDARDTGLEAKGLIGRQIAAQGATGIALTSPSSINSRQRLSELSYEDQIRRVEAGSRQAANYRTESNMFKAEAGASKTAGALALTESFFKAGSYIGSSNPTKSSPSTFTPKPIPRSRTFAANYAGGFG